MTRNQPCSLPSLALATIALAMSPVAAQRIMQTLLGEASGDHFGWCVARLGDLDADGHADFAVGAPFADNNGSDSGSVYVYSGRTLTLLVRHDGPAAGDWYGTSVATAGDVDNDGTIDLLIGAPGSDQTAAEAGLIHVMSGTNRGASGPLLTRTGDTAGDHFGVSVSGGADLDFDRQLDDFAVGAPGDPEDMTALGWVRTFLGDANLGQVSTQHTLRGPTMADRFGHSVAVHGDVDGDGFHDLLVGAPLWDAGSQSDAGFARLYSSRQGQQLHTVIGSRRRANLGWSVASASQVIGGTAPEWLVGARFEADRGRANVINGDNGSIARSHLGFVRTTWFGTSVGNAGDIDQDGTTDFIFGSPLHGAMAGAGYVEPISGKARVVSGATGQTLFSMDGFSHLSWFGFAVSGVDDVNNDGFDDFVVGAPVANQSTGEVHVFSGGQPSLQAAQLAISTGNGGTQTLLLNAGPQNAGAFYFLLGTLSGTRPGITFGPVTLPLNLDPYFSFTLNAPNGGPLQMQAGTLDATGRATATFGAAPLQLPSGLVGQTLQHAFILLSGATITFVSNPLPVFIDV